MDSTKLVYISTNLDIPNGCPMECRINAKGSVEFTLGTYQGSVEILFDRYALQCFTELATEALTEPLPDNQAAARPVGRANA